MHVPSLLFAYNVVSHSIIDNQPYDFIFRCKAPTVSDTWLGLASCKLVNFIELNIAPTSLLHFSGALQMFVSDMLLLKFTDNT